MKTQELALILGVALAAPTFAVPQNDSVNDSVSPQIKTIDTSDSSPTNSLGGRNGIYQQEPSRAEYVKSVEYGKSGAGLKITFDKRGDGGPHNDGGFCGFYTVLHKGPDDYLDASPYAYLMFWVRGERGNEKFKVGAADKHWGELDDSVKSKEIGCYLRAGKITDDWQLAIVPLADFMIDWKQAHAFSICFETDLFENNAAHGTVFIDEITLIQDKPAQ